MWLFVGTIAAATTAMVFLTELDEIVFGLVGTFFWLVWAYGATGVTQTSRCCVVRESYPALALLGGGMAVVMLMAFLRGSVWALNPDDGPVEEPMRGQQ